MKAPANGRNVIQKIICMAFDTLIRKILPLVQHKGFRKHNIRYGVIVQL